MVPIILLFFVIGLSLFITKIAATALMMTGLSRDTARFQARSAYCGVGFTTTESESITGHPVRRRIIMILMLLGNAGIATVVATIILSMTNAERSHWAQNLLVMACGITLLAAFGTSKIVDQRISQAVKWALRNFTRLDLQDYTALLQMAKGYTVVEVIVKDGDWLAEKTLASLGLPHEGVLILGVTRTDGTYIGTPIGTTKIAVGDKLALYGKLERIDELNSRREGVVGVFARRVAVKEHFQEVAEEAKIEAIRSEFSDQADSK